MAEADPIGGNDTVRAALIGCGAFGAGILAQAQQAPGVAVTVIADTDAEVLRAAAAEAGIPLDALLWCADAEAVRAASAEGQTVAVTDPLLACGADVDIVTEATGNAEAGARHALAAIEQGRHVAMVNKETDATVGPLLNRLARQAGVVYTAVMGDQHGALVTLVHWTRSVGLSVVCGGKALDDEYIYDPASGTVRSRYGTNSLEVAETDAWALAPATADRLLDVIAARRELLAPLGGSHGHDITELTIVANAAGLDPDNPLMHAPRLYTCEIPLALRPRSDGGLLSTTDAVDAVTIMRQPHEAGFGGGVFVVAAAGNPIAARILRGHGHVRLDDGCVGLISPPYHFLGVQTVGTLLDIAAGRGLYDESYAPRWDAAARAAVDIAAGASFSGRHSGHGDLTEEYFAPAMSEALPYYLASGCTAAHDIAAGTVITRASVTPPADSVLWALRAEQNAAFGG